MGGYSSGRYRTRTRGAIEATLRVDVRRLRRLGYLHPGQSRSGVLTWSISDRPSGSISIAVHMGDPADLHAVLTYTSDGDPRRQRVEIEARPCRYGGWRHYFRCPHSGERCEVLAYAASRFASRKAQRLSYYSQSEDQLGRLHRARLKAEARIDGTSRPRPRGANRRRLLARWIELERATDDLFAATAMQRFGVEW